MKEAKKILPLKYMLDKYAGCRSFLEKDREIAQEKSITLKKVRKIRKDIYNISTDIKMVNPSGSAIMTFTEFWNSNKLTKRDKDWLLMRFNHRYTYEKIGEEYGLTKDTVHKRFKKIFRLISRNCNREEIFKRLFLVDKLDYSSHSCK